LGSARPWNSLSEHLSDRRVREPTVDTLFEDPERDESAQQATQPVSVDVRCRAQLLGGHRTFGEEVGNPQLHRAAHNLCRAEAVDELVRPIARVQPIRWW
jgi:hypothetical protein